MMVDHPEYDVGLDAETTDLLDTFKFISKIENRRHIWQDGEYRGCEVTYTNPLHPDLQTVFHPYIPLSLVGVKEGDEPTSAMPKVTREYFLSHGWPVPPGDDECGN